MRLRGAKQMTPHILFAVLFTFLLTSLFWITSAQRAVKKWRDLALEYEQEIIKRRSVMNVCGSCAAEFARETEMVAKLSKENK